MSVLALCGGILLYSLLHKHLNPAESIRTPLIGRFSGAQAYETAMQTLTRSAEWLLKLLGTVRIQPQLYMVVLAMLVVPLALAGLPPGWRTVPMQAIDPFFAALWLIGGACAIAGAWMAKYHRLAALVLFGGTGVVTAATFLWLSAPDLALTQLMVETATTVLILLGLRWLPPRLASHGSDPNTAAVMMLRRTLHMALAIASGLAMAVLSFAVLIHPASPTIADFFLLKSLSEGGGSNVVNVLLVDFRGFDTMGEVTVLSIVALTIFALLRRFRPAAESTEIPAQQRHAFDPANQQLPVEQALNGYLMVAGIYLRLLLPFMGVIAIYFFMRGHNQPGGGFVAGLIFAVAIITQYMLAGTSWVESHITMRPLRWLSVGLLLLLLTGSGAWLFGHPFLTTHTAVFELPLLGSIHLPSAVFFDLGVFAVVVGTTMLLLVALAHQSLRAHRKPGETSDELLAVSSRGGV